MNRIIFVVALLLVAKNLFGEVVAPNGSKRLENYRTSWIGNSYGGLDPETGKGQWVQQDIAAICVTPDGTVYTNVPWEEGGGNCMMYKDGKMLGHAGHTHGWGFNGGKAVAVNDKYVFIALKGNNENGGLKDPDTWPPKGFDWHGVSRRLRSDFTKGAPFEGGKGGKGDTLKKSFLVVNEVPVEETETGYITGLCADNERLYVNNPLTNKIEVYDAETLKKLSEWNLPEIEDRRKNHDADGQIALDKDGNLWVLLDRPDTVRLGDRFVIFDKNGTVLSFAKELSKNQSFVMHQGCTIAAFCFDPKGRLVLATSTEYPRVALLEIGKGAINRVIVLKNRVNNYGIEHATINSVFHSIAAVGCDSQDNVYVASNWSLHGGGTVLESFSTEIPDEQPVQENKPRSMRGYFDIVKEPVWDLNWRLFGLCFIDCATLDPEDETTAHTKEEVYKIDWSKEPGQEWSFKERTVYKPNLPRSNESRYEAGLRRGDPRQHIKDSGGGWVRWIGQDKERVKGPVLMSARPRYGKVIFVNDMNGRFLQAYVNDGQFFAPRYLPVALFSQRHVQDKNDWLSAQPEKGEWIWLENDKESAKVGLFKTSKEFESNKDNTDAPPIEGWWVDTDGNVWQATLNQGIRRFRFQGLTSQRHLPVWNYQNMDNFPHPAEFTQVKRIRYIPETDTLYLGGCATVDGIERKNQHWKPMGPVICRYDNFLAQEPGVSAPGEKRGDRTGSGGLHPRLKWKTVLPYVSGSKGHESCEPMGFDVAGDYIFVPYTGASKENGFKTGHVEVLRADDASPVGWMEPDPKTVGEIGLQDMRESLSAHKLKSGEYVIFLEDDYKAKVVMYRWKP